jgi:class 3 adenylate cyclase/tetratricopeptide (TPR) repeat protein
MHCRRCGHDNRPQARFCERCAAPLGSTCAGCGAALAASIRFCPDCGHPVAAAGAPPRLASPGAYTPPHLAERIFSTRAAMEGERKQVTVLFADMKGSMELMADRDPEEARYPLDGVIERMMDAVHRYEGTVNQVMGDGIMALFGAPLAHEDHAVRACYAALGMQEAVKKYSEELQRTRGISVSIRVGLNSGEVVVRSIGSDLRMDYTAVGQTTHLAARMEQLASAGSVLATAGTLRLAEGYVEVRPVGQVAVKGLGQPVEAFEVLRAGPARTRLHAAAARGLTRFVGRRAEMAALGAALGRVASGHGQVVAIVGDAGVGKSRLVWELVHGGALEGWRLLEAHAAPYGKGWAYLPLVDLLEAYLELPHGADHAEIRERVAAVLDAEDWVAFGSPALALLGVPVDDPEWVPLDAERKQRRIFEAVRHLLVRGTRGRPACVVIEDLHWADPETLAILDLLVDDVAAAPLLLLVTYRPEHHHDWNGKPHYRELAVDTLAEPDTEALLRELLGSGPHVATLARLLAERIGGHPFFLEEAVRDLLEAGALVDERGQRRLTRMPMTVPDTVQAVLAARIDRLLPDDKRVLQTASVIGKDVPRWLLEAVVDVAPDALAPSLARLQAARFLYETRLFPDSEYAFAHALTLEVAYGGILRERRRRLDARIVEAIEARPRVGHGQPIERLAHHAFRGELWDKALTYCREAGRQALSRFAHRSAAAYFEQALVALGHGSAGAAAAALAIDIRLELRFALLPLGQYRRMLELLTEAEALAEALGDRRRLGLISCLLCNQLALRFDFPGAIERGQRALEIAAGLDDAALGVATSAMLALAYYGSGQYPRAGEAGARAAGDAEDVPRDRFGIVVPPRVYGGTLASWALAETGRFAEAMALATGALAAAEALGHPHSVIFGCLGVGMVHLRQGAAEDAVGALERALAIWEGADLPAVLIELAGPLASAYCLAGRPGDAIALLERAVAQALVLRHRLGHALRTGGMAEAHLAAGRPEEAAPLARIYVDMTRMVGGEGHIAWGLHLLGDVAARCDPPDADAAESALAEALALARRLGMRPLEARVLLTRGRLLDRLGRADGARALVTEAAGLFAALDMPRWVARCRAD